MFLKTVPHPESLIYRVLQARNRPGNVQMARGKNGIVDEKGQAVVEGVNPIRYRAVPDRHRHSSGASRGHQGC